MNLNQVLDVALPEMPALKRSERYPCVHPKLIAREQHEREGKLIMVTMPTTGEPTFFRFPPLLYQLAMLFDGQRSYDEIASLYTAQTGNETTAAQVREFAGDLEKLNFWYKSPEESSALICEQIFEKRQKTLKRKEKQNDLSVMYWWWFDPGRLLTWAHDHFQWMYKPWYLAWSLFMVAVALLILGSHWHQFWMDSVNFYTLTGFGVRHVFEFFGMFFLLGAMHEVAHGMTCVHFGATPRRMGLFTVYLVPGVFCDLTEVWVYANRWQRIWAIMAGVWSEVVASSYASVVWWVSPPGSFAHNAAYMVLLSGGIFCVLINWNPLAKMDGYYLLSELFRFWDLKGQSTAYLVAIVRKYIFHLPANPVPMPPLRRFGFAVYALLSGLYSYSLLLFFVKIMYRVGHAYSPQWAFAPATALALIIFKSRIKKLLHFMKELYIDKAPMVRAHWRPILGGAVALLVIGLLPLRRENIKAPFSFEPGTRALLRAQVPGKVVQVLAEEGQKVEAGALLVQLRDLGLETRAARAEMDVRNATARATEAQLHYADFGAADQQRQRAAESARLANDQVRELDVRTPIGGIVVTPRVKDLLGSYATAGTELLEVADLSTVRARIYVLDSEMRTVSEVKGAVLLPAGNWFGIPGQVTAVSAVPQPPDAGLISKSVYAGMQAPAFFAVTVMANNKDLRLRAGESGTAIIYGRRRSFLGLFFEPLINAVARRIW